MKKQKAIKLLLSTSLLLLTAWIAVPKVYIHDLLHHHHTAIEITKETQLHSEQSTEDCEFEKYNKPVYFHIFTFISKLVPVKSKNTHETRRNHLFLPAVSIVNTLLRAPPVTE